MKTVLFIFFVIFVRFSSYAQDTTATASGFQDVKKNTIYFEALGNALICSVNYDRLVTPNIACRAGLSPFIFLPFVGGYNFYVPLSVSYLLNFKNTPSYLELGLGTTFFSNVFTEHPTVVPIGQEPDSETIVSLDISIVPIIGYRLQPQQEGFNFRVFYSPHIFVTPTFISKNYEPFHWFGISLGHTF